MAGINEQIKATLESEPVAAGDGGWTRDAVRLETLLEDASIKLSAVASSVTTVWARAMLAELVAGNRDAPAMSDLAQSKGRRKIQARSRH